MVIKVENPDSLVYHHTANFNAVFSLDQNIYVGVFMLGFLGIRFQTRNGQTVCTLGEVH